ncbi:MAG: SRPBCC domain-containing protein [Myxococcota bacterium]
MNDLRTLEAGVWVAAHPAVTFDAWLSSATHTAMSGQPAFIDARPGGYFSLWSGSVRGEFVHLKRPQVIAQTWRTSDFPANADDSRVELRFRPHNGGTQVSVVHAYIPPALYDQFRFGWTQFLLPRLRELVLPNGT